MWGKDMQERDTALHARLAILENKAAFYHEAADNYDERFPPQVDSQSSSGFNLSRIIETIYAIRADNVTAKLNLIDR